MDVENCGLQHLQPTQFLETLAAARNKLKGVDVGGLQKLKYLDLRQNDLTGILNLPSLPALAELFLGHNQLKQFDLKPSPVLATIEVYSNSLQKLPESLGRCINLRALDASNNDLAELPCSLGTLPKLQRIALDGNPLRSVRRDDVIERGCEAIKAADARGDAGREARRRRRLRSRSRWRIGSAGSRMHRGVFLLQSHVDGV